MSRLLVCVDGSAYADNICGLAAWVAERMGAGVDLLHVLRRHSDYEAPSGDHTGSIGFGARADLLAELTKVDETRGRLDQEKGKLILEHAEVFLRGAGVEDVRSIHRRGGLLEILQEHEDAADFIFMGKRGEHADVHSEFLGSNLERVVRGVHKPLFVVSSVVRPIARFLISYDGKGSVRKAVSYIASQPLLKGLECHLLVVEQHEGALDTSETEAALGKAGFSVVLHREKGAHADEVIASCVVEQDIDLLVTGAYSHSRLRNALLGSTTASLIKSCHVPLLLFR